MIEQQGRVMSVSPGRATILLGGSSGCASCDEGKGCGAGIFGRLIRRKPMTLQIDNDRPLLPGQAVMVGIPETFFLRLLARFYLLPLLACLLGAVLGHSLALVWQLNGPGQDLSALLVALFFGAVTLFISRAENHGQAGENLVQIVGYPASQAGQLCQVNPVPD
jgi:sigma-E factor negative regulatory protein RseC